MDIQSDDGDCLIASTKLSKGNYRFVKGLVLEYCVSGSCLMYKLVPYAPLFAVR